MRLPQRGSPGRGLVERQTHKLAQRRPPDGLTFIGLPIGRLRRMLA